jgi:hypothetical protein
LLVTAMLVKVLLNPFVDRSLERQEALSWADGPGIAKS